MTGFISLSRAMFRGFIRDRAALIFSILLPVLFLLFFGAIYKNSSAPKINVVTVGQVQLLTQARQADHGLAKVLSITHAHSEKAALADVRKGDQDAAVLEHGDRVIVRFSIADQTKAGLVNSVFGSIVQAANQAASGQPPRFRLSASQVEDKSLKPIQYFTPGLLGWALASGATFGAGITLVSWRENKLLRRLRLAPIGTGSIILARVGIAVAVGLIQLAVFLAIAKLPYFGLQLTAAWWMTIPLVVCGILAFMAIGLLVGAIAKTQQAATSIANLIILPMAFLGGAFIPLDFAPEWVRQASYVMPLRYLVTGMQDVMARGQGPAAALPAIGILLGFTLVVSLIAVRMFRWDDI
ncbi:MAG: ABC transporter permease [Nocardiopsaceae bacterium]|jgi:ABC-2 type transport system permease protein|nr:ABC transporter permease [Nocardiopsaceae bacterium]